MSKRRQPKRCKGCQMYCSPHKKSSPHYESEVNNWCCRFGVEASKATQQCIDKNGARYEDAEVHVRD